MKIKLWYRITDLGDGSQSVKLFITEKKAREGLDEDGFREGDEIPCQVDHTVLDLPDRELS